MIYKDINNTEKENKRYFQTIDKIAQEIVSGYLKGKKVLLITGSGISSSVPGMQELMDKLKELITDYDDTWQRSEVFNAIFYDYCNADDSEKHQMQSKLLTYVQNSYLNKEKYVQHQDLKPLSEVWGRFVEWLMLGDSVKGNLTDSVSINNTDINKQKTHKGVLQAEPSQNHNLIRELYQQMNAISITTNFDNLLQKAFQHEEVNFYPILDIQTFDKYYLSDKDDSSFIEIQSRGDVFWLECTGTQSKICPNKHRQCFVPGENVKVENGKVFCNLCGSEAKIYFAFPGTKEKDVEMSQIIDRVWKYIANSISYVIVTGNSMDYDPVLVEFLRELIRKKKIPVLYVSRYKGKKDIYEIYKKAATRFLFADYEHTRNTWARAKETEEILRDIMISAKKLESNQTPTYYNIHEKKNELDYFGEMTKYLFDENRDFSGKTLNLLQHSTSVPNVLDIEEISQMRHFSQLGLKTYWLHGDSSAYKNHNRLKHSVGVMLIASYLYFIISPEPNREELTFLQLGALLHDLGHLPFSHLLEEVFDEFGWIPSGEIVTFNHEQRTRRLIEQLVSDNNQLRQTMEDIGYSADELQQLINGEYGKGYLDALINSPIDCDKIEYLYSDAIFMHRGTEKDFRIFIQDYAEDLTTNVNNFLVMQGDSTRSFLKLIRMRGEMYDQVYLRSGLRYLEACCKLIIRTYMAYACAELDVFSAVEDVSRFPEYFNLSDSKIDKIIAFMEDCLKEIPQDEVCEIHVLRKMVNKINENSTISDLMKNTVNECMKQIEGTRGDKDVTAIEKNRILTYEVFNDGGLDKAVLKQLLKNLYLRFPGVILIDYVESKSSFSFGKRETRRRRSDGTKSATENILIKDICQVKGRIDTEYKCLGDAVVNVNSELNYSNHSYINIYRISNNLFSYMQAEDYILNELRKEGIIDG